MTKKRILITGVSGLLGNNLAYCLKKDYEILGLYHSHPFDIEGIKTRGVDLLNRQDMKKVVAEFSPHILIHSAAISDVDINEQEPELAFQVNVNGTKNVVESIKGSDIKLIYICTDLVYGNSNGRGGLREDDPVEPINQYGRTKYEGEQEALNVPNAVSLRTNIFGWNIQPKHSLAEWIIEELKQKKEINGFKDVIFSGIYTVDLGCILKKVIEEDLSGIYNLGSRNHMTKFDFAVQLAKQFHLDEQLVHPLSINQFEFVAKRRKNLALDVSKLERDLNINLPTMEETIASFHKDYENNILKAIKGSTYPKLDFIPYGRQSIDEDDIACVVDTLKSQNITQGPKIREFEQALTKVTDAQFSVAVNSGTSALHIACLAAGIRAGDEVITSSNSFVASANCVVYCQGIPVFADIDPQTYNILPSEIEKKISKRTKAIIPVHFAGQSCDMEAIQHIVKESEKKFGHKIYIIEDAAHALGSQYKETKVGSCAYADMTVMSFHPVKHVTTGEGGVVLTNDRDLNRRLNRFRSHGITSDVDDFVYKENALEGKEGNWNPWYYEQQCLGYNYRITDIQCALGISQLKKLDQFRKRRRQLVSQYNEAFKNIDIITTPFESNDCNSNSHLYVLLFDFKKLRKNRTQVMMILRKKNILTQVHYIPIHTQPYYQKHFNTQWGDCPNTEEYYSKCLSIPLFPTINESVFQKIVDAIRDLVKK